MFKKHKIVMRIKRAVLAAHYSWRVSALSESESLEAAEYEASQTLKNSIGDNFQFIDFLYNLTVKVNGCFTGRPINRMSASESAAIVLIARIANGLRAVLINSRYGYGAEACSLVASLHEFSYELAFFCQDSKEAEKWIQKSEHLTAGFGSVRPAIRAVLKNMGVKDVAKHEQLEYEMHQKLCALKHGNPNAMTFHSPAEWAKYGTSRFGPDASEFGQQSICFAIQMAGQSVALALREVVVHLVEAEKQGDLLHLLDEANAMRNRLVVECGKRWSGFL